jgi:endogenous inhibitor of DNA gyrase (YacG/DUF329 family)
MTWLIYKDKCPGCGAEVARHAFSRFGFCRGACDILLSIPSYRDVEKAVSFVCFKIGDGDWQKITRSEYESMYGAVSKVCQVCG